jgi:hypothetical protein
MSIGSSCIEESRTKTCSVLRSRDRRFVESGAFESAEQGGEIRAKKAALSAEAGVRA